MRTIINDKRGMNLVYQVIVHLILIALIVALLFLASVNKVNSYSAKRQVLERQIALMIDSAPPGTIISVFQSNKNGIINNVRLENGNVLVDIDGNKDTTGYPYFSRYSVNVLGLNNGMFSIKVEDKNG